MDKENPFVFSAVAKDARRLAGRGSPKSEPQGNRPSGATMGGAKAIGAASAKWHSESPARTKAQKQRGNDSPSCQTFRPPLSPLDPNLDLRPSQPTTASHGKTRLPSQRKSSTVSKQLDFLADFSAAQPAPSVIQTPQAAAAMPTDDGDDFEDQNGPTVRRRPPSEQEMASRALQSLHIDHDEEGDDDPQRQQLLLGSKIMAAEALQGPLSSSLTLSETTSEGTEGDAGAVDPEKAMQMAWRPEEPSAALTDDFEVFCDETQCSYMASEPIHALHGFPAPAAPEQQQGSLPQAPLGC